MLQNLSEYFQYHKRNFLLVGAYVVVLASIPLSFTLVQSSQIFKSRASGIENLLPKTQQSTASAVPKSSPLEDLKKLSAQPFNEPGGGSASSPSSSAVSFGPTLKLKVAIEGRSATNQLAKLFLGISSGQTTTQPTHLLTFSIDLPANGVYSGLSLAGLNSGSTYTVYIKGPGQIDKAVEFSMSASETNLNAGQAITLVSGDVNDDNTINSADYTIVGGLIGTNSKSSNWNAGADFNGDNVINSFDLAYVNKNMGKTGDSGVWGSPTPEATSSGSPAGSSTGGYWMYFPPVD